MFEKFTLGVENVWHAVAAHFEHVTKTTENEFLKLRLDFDNEIQLLESRLKALENRVSPTAITLEVPNPAPAPTSTSFGSMPANSGSPISLTSAPAVAQADGSV